MGQSVGEIAEEHRVETDGISQALSVIKRRFKEKLSGEQAQMLIDAARAEN